MVQPQHKRLLLESDVTTTTTPLGAALAGKEPKLAAGTNSQYLRGDKTWQTMPSGTVGAQGPIGPAGPKGTDGSKGADGAVGPVGPAGPTGPKGTDGVDGAKGADGSQGPVGPAGITGQGVVYWNATTKVWGARPLKTAIPYGVLFLSTNDSTATPPSDVQLAVGDRWLRHPDAV